MMTDPQTHFALIPIAQNKTHDKWRTEAMRARRAARLIFIGRGQGRITVSGLTSGYGANNLIYIPCGTMFGFEVGSGVFGQMLTIPQAMDTEWPDRAVHLRLRDVVAQKEALAHLDALERELKSQQPGHERAALYQLGLLSVFFERQIAIRMDDADENRAKSAPARLVAAYTDLIERDFRKHQGVAGYAAALGVTPTHLTRCCRQTCGRSALALLNDRILFDARMLLRDTKLPVNKIAQDLGFGSAAYFTRAFQSQAGMTPSQFRKKEPLGKARDA